MQHDKWTFHNIIFCITAAMMAWGLKYHYSIASAGSLKWILAPTAALVEFITRHPFMFEPGAGYVSQDMRIIIAPACAGVNFLIAAFSMNFFCGIFQFTGFRRKALWLLACSASALLATICINAARIWISIAMISADIHAGWLTPERIHRLTGILIYFFSLSLFYHIIQKIICWARENAFPIHQRRQIWFRGDRLIAMIPIQIFPLIFYWGIAIGIPAFNGAYKNDSGAFFEHCTMVAIGSICILLFLEFLKRLFRFAAHLFFKQPALIDLKNT